MPSNSAHQLWSAEMKWITIEIQKINSKCCKTLYSSHSRKIINYSQLNHKYCHSKTFQIAGLIVKILCIDDIPLVTSNSEHSLWNQWLHTQRCWQNLVFCHQACQPVSLEALFWSKRPVNVVIAADRLSHCIETADKLEWLARCGLDNPWWGVESFTGYVPVRQHLHMTMCTKWYTHHLAWLDSHYSQ